MSKTYVIQWKSRVNGRTGRGTKLFDREEAERLVQELNREYPKTHEALGTLNAGAPAPPPAPSESGEGQDSGSGGPLHALVA